MNSNTAVPPTPEEDKLKRKRQELADLQNQLVERELHLADLKGEMAAFEKLYLKVVGAKYAELDETEAQVAEERARREPQNPEQQNAARSARARAQESRASTSELARSVSAKFSPSQSLKSLYRQVARKIHPDLATDEADRANLQKLMAEANSAYEEGNEARLRAILEEYQSSPEAVQGEGTAAELIRVIRKIAQVKRRFAEIAGEMTRMMESDLMLLKTRVDEASKNGRNVLNEMAAAVSLRISEAQAKLKDITEAQQQ